MAKGKFALGALVGMAAGVVAGILTAPKSGKETRADIKNKAEAVKADASAKADDLRKKGETKAKDVKEMADDYRGRAERAVSSARREFEADGKKSK